jgi:hypothetical protein
VLTEVQVTNSRGATLRLPIATSAGGFAVRDIEGLDPVAATLTTSSQAGLDGAQSQNAQVGTRTILMKLGLMPDYVNTDVRSLRNQLYDYFLPKAEVTLAFLFDGLIYAVAAGQVETFDCPLFTQDPEADISIVCYDPAFRAPQVIEFDDLTNDTQVPFTIDYEGSVPCGIIFSMTVNLLGLGQSVTEISLINASPDNITQRMLIDGTFQVGDVITINTIPLQRAITLTRNNISQSLLSGFDETSDWVMLSKGVNYLRASSGVSSQPFDLTYTPLYGGL